MQTCRTRPYLAPDSGQSGNVRSEKQKAIRFCTMQRQEILRYKTTQLIGEGDKRHSVSPAKNLCLGTGLSSAK
jgi:hypothetical protein